MRKQDTNPKIEKVLIGMIRDIPPWKKCQQVSLMTQACRQLALAGLRDRYPHTSEEELRRKLAVLWLGKELAAKVYGWDPGKENI
jgi:hypothetical protein